MNSEQRRQWLEARPWAAVPRDVAAKLNPLIGSTTADTAHNVGESILRLAGALCDAKAAIMDPPDLWAEFKVLAAALMYEHDSEPFSKGKGGA